MPGEGIGVWSKIDSIFRSKKISAIFYSYARSKTEIQKTVLSPTDRRFTSNRRRKYFLSVLKEN